MIITMGFAGGFTGGWFASRGDPFWTISCGLAGVIGVSAGADVYAPIVGYLIAMLTAVLVFYAGREIERRFRVDDAVGAVAVHGVAGFLGVIWVGVFAAGYPTGLNNVESSLGGQLMGVATFVPLGFLSGYISSWVLKKLNLLRVPLEVEVEGLDLAEYEQDFFPEHQWAPEQLIEPDGRLVSAHPVLLGAALELNGRGRTELREEEHHAGADR
jgi:ammonia channel protein AmtB